MTPDLHYPDLPAAPALVPATVTFEAADGFWITREGWGTTEEEAVEDAYSQARLAAAEPLTVLSISTPTSILEDLRRSAPLPSGAGADDTSGRTPLAEAPTSLGGVDADDGASDLPRSGLAPVCPEVLDPTAYLWRAIVLHALYMGDSISFGDLIHELAVATDNYVAGPLQ